MSVINFSNFIQIIQINDGNIVLKYDIESEDRFRYFLFLKDYFDFFVFNCEISEEHYFYQKEKYCAKYIDSNDVLFYDNYLSKLSPFEVTKVSKY